MVLVGFTGVANGLIALQIKRMSVAPAFAYGYIASLVVGALPGCVIPGVRLRRRAHSGRIAIRRSWSCCTTGACCPSSARWAASSRRTPCLPSPSSSTRNDVLPKWLAYMSIWMIVTELLAGPVFIFHSGRWRGTARSASGWGRWSSWCGGLHHPAAVPDDQDVRHPTSGSRTDHGELPSDAAPTGRAQDGPAGDSDMWVFVLGDLVIFGGYFLIFMIYRHQEPQLFLESQQHLSLTVGVVNTLRAAGQFVVRRQRRSRRRGRGTRRARGSTWSSAVGSAACCSSRSRHMSGHRRVAQGLTFPHNDFFMFYYLLTGVHLFHVMLGLVFLGRRGRRTAQPGQASAVSMVANRRDLLAHGRPALDRHLRSALRDEVIAVPLVKNRLTVVWAILAGLTVVSWALAPGHSPGHAVASVTITVVVLVMALIKSRLIIREFMEVRTAPHWLGIATDGWLVVLWARCWIHRCVARGALRRGAGHLPLVNCPD